MPTSKVQHDTFATDTIFHATTTSRFQEHLQEVEEEVQMELTMTIEKEVAEATV